MKKEKIGCPITLGEYERIIAEEKKTGKELIKEIVNTYLICGPMAGISTYHTICAQLHPSNFAASLYDSGTPRNAP